MLCEVFCPASPLVDGISNEQLVAAFGADLVLLNMFAGDGLANLKSHLGRPVGVNVEPSDKVPEYRRASRDNLRRIQEADFVVVTANPDTEVGTEKVISAVELTREMLPGAAVFAGKMHGSGGRGLVESAEIARMARVADVVLIPAPGTVPGSRESVVAELVDAAHAEEALAVMAVGTSQEGADADTVSTLALASKRVGGDILHLGDAGVSGITDPMNILAASVAIRGRRHTYRRMAMR